MKRQSPKLDPTLQAPQRLTTVVERFEQAWAAGSAPTLTDFLKGIDDAILRRETLIELVAADLWHRWRQPLADRDDAVTDPAWTLEDYVRRYPELGPLEKLTSDLIEEEYRVRSRWGDQPAREEYYRRFPGKRDTLVRKLKEIDRQASTKSTRNEAVPSRRPQSRSRTKTPPPTLEVLVQRLTESGLISRDDVRGALARSKAGDAKPTAERLARQLVGQQLLTEFQARMVYHGRGENLKLGPYRILDQIGAGGMGRVYKAKHLKMDRDVAIKVMSRSLARDPDAVRRFHREVRVLSKLTHPNVVAAFDAGEQDGVHFLVTELVDGDDLSTIVHDHGPLAVSRAVDYIRQAACGLESAHRRGIVHRDVKPSNLLLDRAGCVKVLDVGLARLERQDSGSADNDDTAEDDLTRTGTVMGTVDYLAPEQAMDSKQADARSDIYSLGCTLHVLLTGRPIYSADTVLKKIFAHRHDPIPSLRDRRREVPAELDSMFQRMVAKDAGERYPSMSELIADLEQVLLVDPQPKPAAEQHVSLDTIVVGDPPAATPEGKTPAAQHRPRRIWLVPLVTVICLACLGGTAWMWSGSRRTTDSAAVVQVDTTATDTTTPLLSLDEEEPERVGIEHEAQQDSDAMPAAEEQRRRALTLIAKLVDAPIRDVGAVITQLAAVDQAEVNPILEEAFLRGSEGSRQRLNCAMALLDTDPSKLNTVYQSLLVATADELPLFLDSLDSYHDQLVQRLWQDADSEHVAAAQRLRVYAALAQLDAGSPKWAASGDRVVTVLLRSDGEWKEWMAVLEEVKPHLGQGAVAAFLESPAKETRLTDQGQEVVALIGDRPELITELVSGAGPLKLNIVIPLLRNLDPAIWTQLETRFNGLIEQESESARGRSNLAVTLWRSGRDSSLWERLGRASEEPWRTFLVHHLVGLGVSRQQIVARLTTEDHPQVCRVLLLSLGIVSASLPPQDRQLVLGAARESFTGASSAAEHSAAAWLLRRLGDDQWLQESTGVLSMSGYAPARDWYVDRLGITMAIIKSSPEGDGDAERGFAIATSEVSIASFKQFRQAHKDFQIESFKTPLGNEMKTFSSGTADKSIKDLSDEGPQTHINWFEAAAFCRWLSEQEGVEDKQMCYPSVASFKPVEMMTSFGESFSFGLSSRLRQRRTTTKSKRTQNGPLDSIVLTLRDSFDSRTGYRLPTVAEWQQVVQSPRPSYTRRELAKHYAWFRDNAAGRLQNVARSMPNEYGIFDLLGNAAEWCFDASEAADGAKRIRYGSQRMVAGGSVLTPHAALDTPQAMPAATKSLIGFRVVRTLATNK